MSIQNDPTQATGQSHNEIQLQKYANNRRFLRLRVEKNGDTVRLQACSVFDPRYVFRGLVKESSYNLAKVIEVAEKSLQKTRNEAYTSTITSLKEKLNNRQFLPMQEPPLPPTEDEIAESKIDNPTSPSEQEMTQSISRPATPVAEMAKPTLGTTDPLSKNFPQTEETESLFRLCEEQSHFDINFLYNQKVFRAVYNKETKTLSITELLQKPADSQKHPTPSSLDITKLDNGTLEATLKGEQKQSDFDELLSAFNTKMRIIVSKGKISPENKAPGPSSTPPQPTSVATPQACDVTDLPLTKELSGKQNLQKISFNLEDFVAKPSAETKKHFENKELYQKYFADLLKDKRSQTKTFQFHREGYTIEFDKENLKILIRKDSDPNTFLVFQQKTADAHIMSDKKIVPHQNVEELLKALEAGMSYYIT